VVVRRTQRADELGRQLDAARRGRAQVERELGQRQRAAAGMGREREVLALQRQALGSLTQGLRQGMAGLADDLSLAVAIHHQPQPPPGGGGGGGGGTAGAPEPP
jgi:hypothetical protein